VAGFCGVLVLFNGAVSICKYMSHDGLISEQ